MLERKERKPQQEKLMCVNYTTTYHKEMIKVKVVFQHDYKIVTMSVGS